MIAISTAYLFLQSLCARWIASARAHTKTVFGHLSNYLHCFRFWSLERVWPKMIRLQSSQTLKNLSLNPFQMIHGSRANQRAAFTTYDRSRPIWPDSRHDRMWNPRWRLQSFENTEPIRTIRFFCKYTKSISKAACLYLLTFPWQRHIRQLNYQEPNVLLTCWWSRVSRTVLDCEQSFLFS